MQANLERIERKARLGCHRLVGGALDDLLDEPTVAAGAAPEGDLERFADLVDAVLRGGIGETGPEPFLDRAGRPATQAPAVIQGPLVRETT